MRKRPASKPARRKARWNPSVETCVLFWLLVFCGIVAGLYWFDASVCSGSEQPRICADN